MDIVIDETVLLVGAVVVVVVHAIPMVVVEALGVVINVIVIVVVVAAFVLKGVVMLWSFASICNVRGRYGTVDNWVC